MKKKGFALNLEQEKAVKHQKGPLLIIAGAGTGKTTVITERIKYLISEKLAKPEEILALTFTEKAAREMEKRVDIALPYGTFAMWISTFHAFTDRILRNDSLNIGISSNFKLLTDAETYLFIKNNIWQFNLNFFRPQGNPYKFIEGMIQHFSRLKDEDVNVNSYLDFAKKIKADKEEKQKYMELAQAYKVYEQLKLKEGVMDFADLIGNTLQLFRKRKSLLTKYQKQFKYILVDEFQDTNFAQYQLVKLLAPVDQKPNLTVVGDDSQSIYKFRGAAISNILSFMEDYTNTNHVVLTTSYRCPQTILDAAYKLIRHNNPDTLESQLGITKNLKSHRDKKGEKIELIHTDKVESEAEKVIAFIREYKTSHKKEYKDFAILVRANNHSAPFIRELERVRIPFQFLGPGSLFQRPEVKDLIAYLQVLADFTDSVSLYRVLSMPIWKLSSRDLIAVLNQAKKANLSLFELLEKMTSSEQVTKMEGYPDGTRSQTSTGLRETSDRIWSNPFHISKDSQTKLIKFVSQVHRHQKLVNQETAGQLLYYFLIDSGLLRQLVEYRSQSEERQVLNITKFFDKLKNYEATHQDASVFTLVDYLELAMNIGESPLAAEIDWTENNAVNILTVHSSKGLEFPVIILPNLVEGRFPSRDRRDKIPIPDELIKETLPSGDYHLQEERRLFYVAMTRAREKLIYSVSNYYGEGKRERKLSAYIYESLELSKNETTLQHSPESQIPLFEWNKSRNEESVNTDRHSEKFKLDFLSYSAIQTFKICPLHFKLRYILRIPTAPSPAQSIGNSVHAVMRDFYNLRHPGEDDEKLILRLLETNWLTYGYDSKRHQELAKAKTKVQLINYLRRPLHQSANPIYLEQGFNFRINPALKILGKIDRVDDRGGGNIEIIDYKTGANIPTQKKLDADLQMTIYALAAVNPALFNKQINQIKMSLYFFDKSQTLSTTRSQDQLNQSANQLLEIRDEIEKSDFHCSQNSICRNCEYKMLCDD